VGVVPDGVKDGGPGGVLKSIGNAAEVPPPPMLRPNESKVIRIRPGGQVEPPKLIFQPKPEYPPLARMARIQGVVRLEAIINRDGTVQDLTLISGHPLLVKAAFDAVSRWRYEPTRLNGQPVEVVMEFDVNFNLNE
jgi:protein TonB